MFTVVVIMVVRLLSGIEDPGIRALKLTKISGKTTLQLILGCYPVFIFAYS